MGSGDWCPEAGFEGYKIPSLAVTDTKPPSLAIKQAVQLPWHACRFRGTLLPISQVSQQAQQALVVSSHLTVVA